MYFTRVHFLRNNREAAYEDMTKLIEKAKNNASRLMRNVQNIANGNKL